MQKRGRYGLLYSYILVPECKRFIKTFLNSFWGLKKSRLYTYVIVCELYYSNPTSSVFFLRCAFVSWIQECQNPEKKFFVLLFFKILFPLISKLIFLVNADNNVRAQVFLYIIVKAMKKLFRFTNLNFSFFRDVKGNVSYFSTCH